MFLFTNYVQSPDMRYTFGYMLISVIGIDLIFNLVIFAYSILTMIYNGFKSYFAKRRAKKSVQNKSKQDDKLI